MDVGEGLLCGSSVASLLLLGLDQSNCVECSCTLARPCGHLSHWLWPSSRWSWQLSHLLLPGLFSLRGVRMTFDVWTSSWSQTGQTNAIQTVGHRQWWQSLVARTLRIVFSTWKLSLKLPAISVGRSPCSHLDCRPWLSNHVHPVPSCPSSAIMSTLTQLHAFSGVSDRCSGSCCCLCAFWEHTRPSQGLAGSPNARPCTLMDHRRDSWPYFDLRLIGRAMVYHLMTTSSCTVSTSRKTQNCVSSSGHLGFSLVHPLRTAFRSSYIRSSAPTASCSSCSSTAFTSDTITELTMSNVTCSLLSWRNALVRASARCMSFPGTRTIS